VVTLRAGIHELGPDTASLVVKTYREGLASKAGHNLIIDVRHWGATLEVGKDPWRSSLQLHADARSLYPREGLRGVKPFTDRDRDEVRKNIDEKVLAGSRSASARALSTPPTAAADYRSVGSSPSAGRLSGGLRAQRRRRRPRDGDRSAGAERVGDQALPRADGRAQGAGLGRGRLRRRPVNGLTRVAYSASEARQEILDTLAEATDELGFALACLADAYDNLDAHNADRLEEELFRPVQAAYGRAQLSHAQFAERHGLPGRTFDQRPAGVSPTGATGFIQPAVEAIGEADLVLPRPQDLRRQNSPRSPPRAQTTPRQRHLPPPPHLGQHHPSNEPALDIDGMSRVPSSLAGLDIRLSESEQRRAAGKLSHQGPPVLRWAVFEAASAPAASGPPDQRYYLDTRERLDGKQATLTIARKLIRRAHHTLRELGEEALQPVPAVP
jgi:hypothetical protein